MENNWKQKSLETLEKDRWGSPPEGATDLVNTVYRLRTVQLEKLAPKDIRLLIGQGVGLKFIVPIALDLLGEDLFVDAELYEGDLLQNVMKIGNDFWTENMTLKHRFDNLIEPYSHEQKEKFRAGKF